MSAPCGVSLEYRCGGRALAASLGTRKRALTGMRLVSSPFGLCIMLGTHQIVNVQASPFSIQRTATGLKLKGRQREKGGTTHENNSYGLSTA